MSRNVNEDKIDVRTNIIKVKITNKIRWNRKCIIINLDNKISNPSISVSTIKSQPKTNKTITLTVTLSTFKSITLTTWKQQKTTNNLY